MGGNELGQTGNYIWYSTGQHFDFTNWSKGQPDNYNGLEHCAHIWDKTDFEWNDYPCNAKIGYICEDNRFVLAARKDLSIKKHLIDEIFKF